MPDAGDNGRQPRNTFPPSLLLEEKVGGDSRSDEAQIRRCLWQMKADAVPMRQRVLRAKRSKTTMPNCEGRSCRSSVTWPPHHRLRRSLPPRGSLLVRLSQTTLQTPVKSRRLLTATATCHSLSLSAQSGNCNLYPYPKGRTTKGACTQ